MNILKIVLIAIIILFIYKMKKQENFVNVVKLLNSSNNTKKKNIKNKKKNNYINNRDDIDLDDLLSNDNDSDLANDYLSSDMTSNESSISEKKNKRRPEIYNIHYNPNFIDVINSIKYLQSNRNIFNIESLPVKYSNNLTQSKINELSTMFVTKLNEYIRKNIILPSNVKSGWDKIQKKLGVPTLYNDNIFKSNLNIYKINSASKYSTKNQNKYILNISFTKENIKEKIVMDINIIENNKNKQLIINNIYIQGYTNLDTNNFETHNVINYSVSKNNGMNDINDMTDISEIQKQLYKRYKKNICHEKRNKLKIDPNGSVFRSDLPYKNNIKC